MSENCHEFLTSKEIIICFSQVSKGNQELSFFSLPEFEEWKNETPHANSWKVKYYKGLGTSTSKEAKEYFSDMKKHRIVFDYNGLASDQAIEMVSAFYLLFYISIQ